jgi:hypothetical protein
MTKSLSFIHSPDYYSRTIALLKVKQSHYRPRQACRFQEFEAPRFQDNRHINVVRLSAIRTDRLYPLEIFLVFIPVRGRVDPRTTVLLEGL